MPSRATEICFRSVIFYVARSRWYFYPLCCDFDSDFFEIIMENFLASGMADARELHKPLVTIGSIVGFACLANYSGMSITIGNALTVTGRFFPFIAPLLGWFGVFITGSDTSSNALFSGIQAQTARSIGVSPVNRCGKFYWWRRGKDDLTAKHRRGHCFYQTDRSGR